MIHDRAGTAVQVGSSEHSAFATNGIETDGVRLRALRECDIAAFHAYRSDPQVARYQGWPPMTEAKARECVREQGIRSDLQPGRMVRFAIAEAATDRLLGDVGLRLSHDRREAELSITVAPSAQGRGVGRSATRAAFALLSGEPALERIRADADARNLPSRRMLVAAGFRDIGTAEVFVKEEACIEHRYRIERDVFARAQQGTRT